MANFKKVDTNAYRFFPLCLMVPFYCMELGMWFTITIHYVLYMI